MQSIDMNLLRWYRKMTGKHCRLLIGRREATTVVSLSELWRSTSQSAVFRLAAFSLFSNKMCLLAVTNSHILRNKNNIPSLSSIVIALKMMSLAVSCGITMVTGYTEAPATRVEHYWSTAELLRAPWFLPAHAHRQWLHQLCHCSHIFSSWTFIFAHWKLKTWRHSGRLHLIPSPTNI